MRRWIYWVFPAVWMGVIFYASSQPYEQQDIKPFMSDTFDLSFLEPMLTHFQLTYHQSEVSVQALGVDGFIEFFIRKGAHFGVFFVLALLVYIALKKTTALYFSGQLAVSFVWAVAYAGIDEWHQSFTSNRTPISEMF
ncbi:VanZ family protein [Lentibacillus sp. JNUCC-1]|uniref:VanZ family protein n=1 Tax=Lentibacillus sp. JNUCC-1 TaxID=2654513 RepID=UPI001E5CA0AD|nr:VanZ family protein [Lentibacillus sp. JNUCC-1]